MASKTFTLALLCLVLLAGARLAEAKSKCGKNVKKGYTLYGSKGEIKSIDWKKGSKHSWDECCKLCEKTKKCKKFLFWNDKFGNTGCAMYTNKAKKVTKSYSSVIGSV